MATLQLRSLGGRAPDAVIPLGLAAAVLGAVSLQPVVAAPAAPGQPFERAIVHVLVVATPVLVGLYAMRSPRHRRFGLLLIAAGGAWSLAAFGESTDSLPYSVGRVAGWLIFPLLIYVMLSFPAGRLPAGRDRALFGLVTLVIVVLYVGSALFVAEYPTHTAWSSCRAACPPNAFFVLAHEPAVMTGVVQPVREAVGIVLLAGVIISMAGRMRTATPLRRRAITPVLAVSTVALGLLVAFLVTRRSDPDAPALDTLIVLWSLCIPGIALAFLVGLTRGRLFIADVLARLSATLDRPLSAPGLQAALASALGDRTLEVLFWDDDRGGWRGADGRPGPRTVVAGEGRGVTEVSDDGFPIAALVHEAALLDEEGLLEAVRAHALVALRSERLTTQLQASMVALDDSRKRIATAADAERRRIERDLHDGAQQRLVVLRMRLSIAEELMGTDPRAGTEAMHALGDQIEETLDEVRSLAHGIYPSVLADRGLEDALRGAARDSPLPAHMKAAGLTRQVPEAESAVYFVCHEALQNAAKHARGATGVWVTLRQRERRLEVEVRDDGAGFPVGPTPTGHGIENMRDRLEALGGRLVIMSSPGLGTRVVGSVPLTPPDRR
jgi:signal transduction histidine kinase